MDTMNRHWLTCCIFIGGGYLLIGSSIVTHVSPFFYLLLYNFMMYFTQTLTCFFFFEIRSWQSLDPTILQQWIKIQFRCGIIGPWAIPDTHQGSTHWLCTSLDQSDSGGRKGNWNVCVQTGLPSTSSPIIRLFIDWPWMAYHCLLSRLGYTKNVQGNRPSGWPHQSLFAQNRSRAFQFTTGHASLVENVGFVASFGYFSSRHEQWWWWWKKEIWDDGAML